MLHNWYLNILILLKIINNQTQRVFGTCGFDLELSYKISQQQARTTCPDQPFGKRRASYIDLCRAICPRQPCSCLLSWTWHLDWRPCCRLYAKCARNCCGHARGDQSRCYMVLMLTRLRTARRSGSIWTDCSIPADCRRWLLLQWEAGGLWRQNFCHSVAITVAEKSTRRTAYGKYD